MTYSVKKKLYLEMKKKTLNYPDRFMNKFRVPKRLNYQALAKVIAAYTEFNRGPVYSWHCNDVLIMNSGKIYTILSEHISITD